MAVGGVDQDIDLGADLAGQLAHRTAVGYVERNKFRLRQLAQRLEAGKLLPRLGFADPDQLGAGRGERPRDGLAGRGLAVGDEDFPRPRIAGEFAHLGILRQIGCSVLGQRHQHALARAVERRRDAHAAWRGADALVHDRQ